MSDAGGSAPAGTRDVRGSLCSAMLDLAARGLNRGTSGNASVRDPESDAFWITPSGKDPKALTPQDIVQVGFGGSWADAAAPSSEWRLHEEIFRRRPDLGAVVHTHSPYATVLACAGQPIRPVHYLIALAGTGEVPVAPYATFGTTELAESAAAALGETGRACLLAHHGLVVAAQTLAQAVELADAMEEQAFYDWHCRSIGSERVLNSEELSVSEELLRRYVGSIHQ